MGSELPAWRSRAAEHFSESRLRFLGFQRDMPAVLAASDLLIHPARYEAYGLAVHEALCRGLPAIVSASAGIAERYPENLRDLLLADPYSVADLAARLEWWRHDASLHERLTTFASRLRSRTWDHMAHEIATIAKGGVT
jgi:glycosyltransferase involved in cell wall biosynthesis